MNTLDYIHKRFNIPKRRWNRNYIQIRGFGRRDLAKAFRELGFTEGVEIGTEKGKYASVLMEANPKLNLMTCDPYIFYEDGEGYRADISDKLHQRNYNQAKERLKYYPTSKIMKAKSMKALEFYEDNSIDFVYIDGNHRLDYVINDIVNWADKVKSGGIVAGHDFIKLKGQMYSHVPYAVEAYRQSYGIKHIFVLDQYGRNFSRTGLDRIRSWFFVKE